MAWHRRSAALFAMPALLLIAALAQAAIGVTDKISDVRGTKHNLSAAGDGTATPSGGKVPARTVKASTETQVCVFCHTPHEAELITFGSGATARGAPLWNRKLSEQTYAPYSSSSMEANAVELAAAPGGSSKLCLSCHDGTMAIDKVNALNGVKNATVAMTTATPVKMPSGSTTTGFTRDLGTDLGSDHPISFTYNSTIAGYDGELRNPDGIIVGNRVRGATPPKMPLENSQMQCSTCHDPHLRDKSSGNGNAKFLRMNRFQVLQPTGENFSPSSDIICLACHEKGGLSWAYSAHANDKVATQTYTAAAAQTREFPSTLDTPPNANPPVWQVACLNCHDTHSIQGARRLLREGTDGAGTPKSGGNPAAEETCYQCHTTSAASAVTYTALDPKAVPDIKTDFERDRRMPIRTANQPSTSGEVHDIGGVFNDGPDANCSKTNGKCGKDFIESRANLGVGALGNRHAECTDCHNPHRVVKFRDFRGNPAGNITGTPDAAGTHQHTDSTATNHTNIASGVLRGAWGVEPTYSSTSFQVLPSGYDVKRGDPGTSFSALVTEPYLTREYQICLKCHSDYGYSDNNLPQTTGGTGVGNRPTLGSFSGGTPSGTNGVTMYTNQAKEFQAPGSHRGEAAGITGSGAGASYESATQFNHRSWHPVMGPTGRTIALRGIKTGNPWRAPWNNTNQIGANTMYCTDCHGSDVASATSVIPDGGDNGNAWGPHGSSNNFLLKGKWDGNSGNANSTDLCFKCHNPAIYRSTNESGDGSNSTSGFSGPRADNLHGLHGKRVNKVIKCNWCHVAVPHGWKNKAFLVNLRDLGPEVGKTAGTAAPAGTYNNGPYYLNAVLRVTRFAKSGTWTDSDCGGKNYMKDTMCANLP